MSDSLIVPKETRERSMLRLFLASQWVICWEETHLKFNAAITAVASGSAMGVGLLEGSRKVLQERVQATTEGLTESPHI